MEPTVETVYRVGDQEFTDRAQADEYARSQTPVSNYDWFVIHHDFDLEEQRGFQGVSLVGAPSVSRNPNWSVAYQYAFAQFGGPMGDSYGTPLKRWIIEDTEGRLRSDRQNLELSDITRLANVLSHPSYAMKKSGRIVLLDGFGDVYRAIADI